MSLTKTTLITNVFNEEYLLPFWLNHHKNMFDEIIVIDYNSTDKSIEICKSICPDCKIITTRNNCFAAEEIDKEIMDIENSIEGIKICLNTTEFIFCQSPLKEIFCNDTNPMSYLIDVTSPYSLNNYDIDNNYELFSKLLNTDIVYHKDRLTRQLHNFPNGKYHVGRHGTFNNYTPSSKAHIIWFGYYPMNDSLLKRKLQIAQNIPQTDKDKGYGFHHLFDKEKLLSINSEKALSGKSLKEINLPLYNIITKLVN
jgi:hypothetical protein